MMKKGARPEMEREASPRPSLLLSPSCVLRRLRWCFTSHGLQHALGQPAQSAELSERYWTLNLKSAPLDWIGEGGGGPLSATAIGDHRFDAQLDDLSPAGRARFLEALVGIAHEARESPDETELPAEDRVTKALLLDLIEATREIQVCDADRWTVDQMNGPQVNLPLTAMYYPLETVRGVEDLVARLDQAGRYFGQQISSLREGLARGEAAPRGNVQAVIAELDEMLKKDAAHSDFLPPPDRLAALAADRRPAACVPGSPLSSERSVHSGAAPLPASFLPPRCCPRRASSSGLWALPQGDACYAAAIRMHTGLRLTPAELHQQGLTLLGQIEAEQVAIARSEKAPLKPDGTPDLKAFEASIAKRPDQFFTREADLLNWAQRKDQGCLGHGRLAPRLPEPCPSGRWRVKAVEALAGGVGRRGLLPAGARRPA